MPWRHFKRELQLELADSDVIDVRVIEVLGGGIFEGPNPVEKETVGTGPMVVIGGIVLILRRIVAWIRPLREERNLDGE